MDNKKIEEIFKNNNKEQKIQKEYLKQYKNTNNYNKVKKFYELRNDIVLKSRLNNIEEIEKYQSLIKNNKSLYKNNQYNPDIIESIKYLLSSYGYNIKELGTEYLLKLIDIFYHERNLYNIKETNDFDYWNLSNYSNIHYKLLNDNSEEVVKEINKSINNNKLEKDINIEEIVYQITDEIIAYSDNKNTNYKKLLKK